MQLDLQFRSSVRNQARSIYHLFTVRVNFIIFSLNTSIAASIITTKRFPSLLSCILQSTSKMASNRIESSGELYLTGNSCKRCQQIVFPGTREDLFVRQCQESRSSRTNEFWRATRYRLGVSLKDMREWSDCSFAGHLLRLSHEELRGSDKPDAIELYAMWKHASFQSSTIQFMWLEDISSDEPGTPPETIADKWMKCFSGYEPGRSETRKKCIQYSPVEYLAATNQGWSCFVPRELNRRIQVFSDESHNRCLNGVCLYQQTNGSRPLEPANREICQKVVR